MSIIYKNVMNAIRIQDQAEWEFQDRGSFSGIIRNISVTAISKQVWICPNLQRAQKIVYPKIQSPRCESKHSNLSIPQDKNSRSFNFTPRHTFIIIGHYTQELFYVTSQSIPTFCVTCTSKKIVHLFWASRKALHLQISIKLNSTEILIYTNNKRFHCCCQLTLFRRLNID